MSATAEYPLVTAIILNWNRLQDIQACLTSLLGSDYPSLRVVVVDNNSKNGSIGVIRQKFPEVTILENERNLGFAGGNNVGISYALNYGTSYVLLLNDDTEVAPTFLPRMVQAAEADSRIGIVGPKIYYFDHPTKIWSAGGTVSHSGIPAHRLIDNYDRDDTETIQDTDYVTGCAMLVRAEVIRRVGSLDERFFAYFEETEWCVRAFKSGFRVVYVPNAHVWHKIEPEARVQSPTYIYLMTRNRSLFLRCRGATTFRLSRTILEMYYAATKMILPRSNSTHRGLAKAVIWGIVDFALGRYGGPPKRLYGNS